jgi:hypothetical protein
LKPNQNTKALCFLRTAPVMGQPENLKIGNITPQTEPQTLSKNQWMILGVGFLQQEADEVPCRKCEVSRGRERCNVWREGDEKNGDPGT